MFRKFFGAACVLALSLGMVMADEFKGSITKIDGKKVTLVTKDAKEGKTFDLDKDCKVCKMVKKTKEEIADGTKADIFTKIGKKGVAATIITNGEGKVTEIIVGAAKKKKDV